MPGSWRFVGGGVVVAGFRLVSLLVGLLFGGLRVLLAVFYGLFGFGGGKNIKKAVQNLNLKWLCKTLKKVSNSIFSQFLGLALQAR